ncbi:MAG: DUF2807 domain-containing protein [Microscillaceae bacterium]|jgi:hypothetical protein|nr:DUF2807 domain-containing protein [Microscillaceae bacterium]
MKKVNLKFLPYLCFMFVFSTSACQKFDYGPIQEEIKTYTLAGFDKVDIDSESNVKITQGANFSIIVRGDYRNLAELDLRVINGTLKSSYTIYRPRKHSNSYEIVMPTLKGVHFSGMTEGQASGFLAVDKFDAKLSGESNMSADMETDVLTMDISGRSNLYWKGKSKTIAAIVSGDSRINTYDSNSEDVKIAVSGGSEAKIYASKTLQANASGRSRVRYRGNPIVDSNVSGDSSVLRD